MQGGAAEINDQLLFPARIQMANQANPPKNVSNGFFEKNLAAFKEHDLHIAALMENYQPASPLRHEQGGRAATHKKVKNFIDNPTFLEGSFEIPDASKFDRYGVSFIRNMQTFIAAENIKCPPLLNDGLSFYLFVFGLGPGLDFGTLLRKFKPTIVIIIEPDLDNLYHSMQADDWQEFVKWQADTDTMFFLLNDDSAELVIAHIKSLIMAFSPAAFTNNPYFFFRDFDLAHDVIDGFKRQAALMLTGLGFLYDETLMMKNTYLNMHSNDCTIFNRSYEANLETPAFVVGAGPSLDADIDFIRQHAEQAIIISTGTALRSLLANGITPDFHVELENIHVYSSILQLSTEFDLSPICLLVSNAIDPHIIKFFDKVVYYYRPGISPYSLLCTSPDQRLCEPGPLVVNASFSLAIDIGAKDIYLIGTDFGSRGTGSDHAKDNVVYTDTAIIGYVRKYKDEVPANFEGQFFASEDFIYGLKAMHKTIALFAGQRNFYNCSDGARVDGATPIRSADVVLNGSAQSKQQDLQSINQRYTALTAEEFSKRWDVPMLQEWINGFCDFSIKILGNKDAYSDSLYLKAFMTLSRRSPKYRRSRIQTFQNCVADCVATMFRGTLDMALTGVRYYLGIPCTAKEKEKLRKTIALEMQALIEHMRGDALAMLADPTDIPPAKAGGKWDSADFVQEAYYTWGDTPRNASCPCGSGKRYKHCHGKQD